MLWRQQWLQLITLKESFTNIHGFPSPFSINFVQKKNPTSKWLKKNTGVFSFLKLPQESLHVLPNPFTPPMSISCPGLSKPTVLQQAFFCSSAQANCQLSTSTLVAPTSNPSVVGLVVRWFVSCGQGDGAVKFSIATLRGWVAKRCQVGGRKKI